MSEDSEDKINCISLECVYDRQEKNGNEEKRKEEISEGNEGKATEQEQNRTQKKGQTNEERERWKDATDENNQNIIETSKVDGEKIQIDSNYKDYDVDTGNNEEEVQKEFASNSGPSSLNISMKSEVNI